MALARRRGQRTRVVLDVRGDRAPDGGAGDRSGALLEALASSPVPTELVLTTLVNELAAAPGDVWLVLDDYHLVDSHEVHEGVAFLLEHLPSKCIW